MIRIGPVMFSLAVSEGKSREGIGYGFSVPRRAVKDSSRQVDIFARVMVAPQGQPSLAKNVMTEVLSASGP